MPKIILNRLSDIASTAAAGINITETEITASAVVADLTLAAKSVQSVGGIAADKSGNVYVSDDEQHVIMKITEDGQINTFAGVAGSSGNNSALQNVAAATARFNQPKGLAVDNTGNVYVADYGNNQIRIIKADGRVSVLAGNGATTSGLVDAARDPLQARFNNPIDVAIDNSGKIYVCDQGNNAIRKIDGSNVLTIAGGTSSADAENVRASSYIPFCDTPTAIAVDANGTLYVCDAGNYKIKTITPKGWVYLFSGSGSAGNSLGTGATKQFTCQYNDLRFSSVDRRGNLYVVSYREDGPTRLVKVNRDGVPSDILDFNEATTSRNGVIGVVCTPAQKLFITITTAAEAESSSESSDLSSSSSSDLSSGSSESSSSS